MQNYIVIGVMSGTSLDGIDIALLSFQLNQNQWKYEIVNAITYQYDQQWIDKLTNAHLLTLQQIDQLNIEYTQYLAEQIKQFIQKTNITNIDAVCSHGHTILHKPQEGYTLQIGNLPILSQILNLTVVCDFRVQDVKLGGNGAPLVPLGDKLLFSEFTSRINLGGFSNISFEIDENVIAYDICPVNTVLNRLAAPNNFDYNGELAAKGIINQELLEQLNQIEYYTKPPPKSLGIEWVCGEIFPILDQFKISQEDKLCTYNEHVAQQIGKATSTKQGSALFTGGGVHNKFLMSRIQNYIKDIKILDQQTNDFKEALIFGLLGILKLRGEINVLKSVTGAKENHSSGVVFYKKEII